MGAEPPATAQSSWNCHPFVMHNFSLGDPTSLSHCCCPQFFVRIDDKSSLIHPWSTEPAAPLFSVPGPQATSSVSRSQHASGKRQAMARGSQPWLLMGSGGSLTNTWRAMSGSPSRPMEINSLGGRPGHQYV